MQLNPEEIKEINSIVDEIVEKKISRMKKQIEILQSDISALRKITNSMDEE